MQWPLCQPMCLSHWRSLLLHTALNCFAVFFSFRLQHSCTITCRTGVVVMSSVSFCFFWECLNFFLSFEGQFCQIQNSWLTVLLGRVLQRRVCLCVCVQKETYQELAHMIMEAEKSQDVQLASWRLRRPNAQFQSESKGQRPAEVVV